MVGAGAATSQLGKLSKGFGGVAREEGKITGRGIAKFAGGAAGLVGLASVLRSSTTATMDLAKGTMALSRISGMDTSTASTWVEMAKVRGVESDTLQTSMFKLAKTMKASKGGSDTAHKAFMKMGVSMDMVKKGEIGPVLGKAADALEAMKNPADKAAYAQELFGKAGKKLLPLLSSGSKGIAEQAAMIDKYGAKISSTADAKTFIAQQREAQYAMDGLKITIGTKVVPVLVQLFKALLDIVRPFQPMLRNTTVLKGALIGLVAGFLALKVIGVAATLSQLGFNGAMVASYVRMALLRGAIIAWCVAQNIATAAQWLFNVAMSANPIGLVILGIVALIALFVLLYTKVGWFRTGVDAVVGFIKAHWPLLLAILTGPFGLAVLFVIRHFAKIRGVVSGVVGWVRTAFGNIVGFIGSLPGRVASAAHGLFDGIKNSFRSAINWVIKAWNNLSLTVDLPLGVGSVSIGTPNLPLLAKGGTVTGAGGSAIVGEAGPELVTLPRGATVVPLGAGAVGGGPIVTKVYLDGRQIAEAIGNHTGARMARA